MKTFTFSDYLSPFTWRYGSEEMRTIWSEVYKRKLWRKIWVSLARQQYKDGLVSKEELRDLTANEKKVNIEKAHEIENEIKHDLMAEIRLYASQAKKGGGKIHLGATSMDIEDNADAVRMKESLTIIEKKLYVVREAFSLKVDEYKAFPVMGYTHFQAAEPTTLGYRFAFYLQDIMYDLQYLVFVKNIFKAKGLKGAVGTAASYVELGNSEKAKRWEKDLMKDLGITPALVSSQTAPRKFEVFIASVLSSIAQSLTKFAFDLRIMQSAGFGELSEPFQKKQVGSSAMPFKRNPILSEQICSLGRLVTHTGQVLVENAMYMGLERTLEDSANRRIVIPQLFLAVDSMLTNTENILKNLVVHKKQIEKNLHLYGSFSGTERVLMTAVKNGADRQTMHEILRENAIAAYKHIEEAGVNPLSSLLKKDKRIVKFVSGNQIDSLLDPTHHIGLAVKKCQELLEAMKETT